MENSWKIALFITLLCDFTGSGAWYFCYLKPGLNILLIYFWCSFYIYLLFLITFGATDIETEKTHQSIFQGVTGFDKSQMRHAETEEKVALPAKEGIMHG